MPGDGLLPDESIDENDPELRTLARAILDGTAVNWEAVGSGPASNHVREFQLLAAFAATHRELPQPLDHHEPSAAAGHRPDSIGTWGTLKLLERLGAGAFGEVFRAWDPRLDREVALKLLHASAGAAAADPLAAIEEGRLLARVRHPNVVSVFGAECLDGRVGVWMELVHGRTLADLLRDHGVMSAGDAATIGVEVCRALSAVHAAGLLHRDVKAHNVMREAGGRVVLMDFGAGRDLRARPVEPTMLTGTPLYLAPELLEGGSPTPQADLYALGVLLYHLTTGSYPVEGASLDDVREAHRAGTRVPLAVRRPDLPAAFVAVVERALARDPAKRYDRAHAFAAALITAGFPQPRPSNRFAAVTLTIGVVAALAAVLWTRSHDSIGEIPFKEQQLILIAAFENRTGNPALEGSVAAALAHELQNSGFVTVASRDRVLSALMLLRQPPDARLTPDLARAVCLRDGTIRAFIAGSVEQIGGRYRLTAQVIGSRDDRVLGSISRDAPDEGALMPTIREVSIEVRERLGQAQESLAAAHAQLARVATPSLRAVALYSQAYELGTFSLQWEASAALAREAVTIDPEFASAHNWLGWSILNSRGGDASVALTHFVRSVELAGNASERERLFIRGSYFMVTRDFTQAAAEYEALLLSFPDDHWAGRNLTRAFIQTGRGMRGFWAALAQRWPESPGANIRLAQLAFLDEPDQDKVRPIIDRAAALMPPATDERVWLDLVPPFLAWLDRDPARSVEELTRAAAVVAQLGTPLWGFQRRAGQLELALGRVRSGERFFAGMAGDAQRIYNLSLAALARGDHASVAEALKKWTPPGGSLALHIWLLAQAGAADQAERALAEYLRISPVSPYTTDFQLYIARTSIELARGRTSSAARLAHAFLDQKPILTRLTAMDLRAIDVTAAALMAAGEHQRAAGVLEIARRGNRRALLGDQVNGFAWLRTQDQLARAYRAIDRVDDAVQIEKEILSMLTLADPDFSIASSVRSRLVPTAVQR